MSILKTTFVTTALIFGSTTTVFAQDAMVDKAKDMAVDKGVDMAKDKAKGMVGDDKAQALKRMPLWLLPRTAQKTR